MFIGYFNLANTVTLLGLASSIMAIFCANQGLYTLALVMLLFAGLCDMFDGRIARNLRGRLRRDKVYGIQLDSLADIVSFGVVPAMLAYNMGFKGVVDLLVYLFFIICGAVRLAYYNTQALTNTKDLNVRFYTGVPIPFSCVFFPLLFIMTIFIKNPEITVWIFRAFFVLLGIAYVLKIKIKKFGTKFLLSTFVFDLICLVIIAFSGEPNLFT